MPRTTSSVTGFMNETFTQNGTIADLNIADPNLQLIQPGHMIKFVNPQNRSEYIWAKIKVILDNGIKIQVPPFIEVEDEIILDTRTFEYVKKI